MDLRLQSTKCHRRIPHGVPARSQTQSHAQGVEALLMALWSRLEATTSKICGFQCLQSTYYMHRMMQRVEIAIILQTITEEEGFPGCEAFCQQLLTTTPERGCHFPHKSVLTAGYVAHLSARLGLLPLHPSSSIRLRAKFRAACFVLKRVLPLVDIWIERTVAARTQQQQGDTAVPKKRHRLRGVFGRVYLRKSMKVLAAAAGLVHLPACLVRGHTAIPPPSLMRGGLSARAAGAGERYDGAGRAWRDTHRRAAQGTDLARRGQHQSLSLSLSLSLSPSSEDDQVSSDGKASTTTTTTGGQYFRGGSFTREGFFKAGGLAAAGVIAAMGAVPGTIVEGRGRADETAEAAVGVDEPAVLLQKEVLSYVREALPQWRTLPDGDIQLKQITGGITNVIFKARNAATGEGALVRVYGKDTDLLLDRRKEAAVFSELSTLGFGPQKLGEFKGGRIEELLDARAATPEELLQTSPFDVPQAIAVQLASLHGQRVRSSAGSPDRPVMWTSIDEWLKTATRLDSTKSFPLAKVAQEVVWLKRNLPGPAAAADGTPGSPDQKLAAEIANGVVFAHNDLLSGNVLVGPRGAKKISTLRLIDFEYSDYNPCGYDIANHFCECAGFDADFRRRYPSDKQRQAFLRAYVEAARPGALQNALSADNVIGELARLVDRYTLASHLTWALWAVIQANTSEIKDFDFAGYATKRLDGYAFHKGEFYA